MVMVLMMLLAVAAVTMLMKELMLVTILAVV